MKKSKKVFLGIVGVLALVGICFVCLSFYAKKEINQPKFELPEISEAAPASPLPTTKEDAFDYVNALYEKALSANDVEGSCHTDVHLTEGERTTDFSAEDNDVLSRVLDKAQGALNELYPSFENVRMTEAEYKPALGFTKADVTDFTAESGYTDENGEHIDDGIYYITLTVNPECVDNSALLESDARKSIEKELSPALTVKSLDITSSALTVSFRISNYNDMLTHTEIKCSSAVRATFDFVGDYRIISDKTEEITIPYETVEMIDFFHYGVHFTEAQLAVQKKDIKALPLEVRVNAETTKDDYKLTFEVSEDGILDISEDGVMTVVGTKEEPLTVKATLEYDGHTYSDELTVYATEMEVKTDEQGN